MQKLIAMYFFLAAMLVVSVAGAQPATSGQCRPTAAYCNHLSGLGHHAANAFTDTPIGESANWRVCTSADPQSSQQVCENTLLRRNVRIVPVGQGVLVTPPPAQLPARPVVSRDPRVPALISRVTQLQTDTTALTGRVTQIQTDTTALTGRVDEIEDRVEGAEQNIEHLDRNQDVLMANQRELARRGMMAYQAASNALAAANALPWRVEDLHAAWRFELMVAGLYRHQFNGSDNGAGGFGFGLLHYPQGSSIGVRVSAEFYPLAYQPLLGAGSPLFTASGAVDAIFGRSMLQGLLGLGGSGAFRFGQAGAGQVRGSTMWDLNARAGLRVRVPFYPSTRPNGPALLVQAVLTAGMGQTLALIRSGPQEPFGGSLGGQIEVGTSF